MAGFQTRIWFCNIRRQGQAAARWGHVNSGVRCAAKWTSHGTAVVSWRPFAFNVCRDLFKIWLLNEHLAACVYLYFCSTKDQIVMVNGEPMDNVHSNYTIQTLKSCGKTANIVSVHRALFNLCQVASNLGFLSDGRLLRLSQTVKRPRKIQIPATSSTRPTRAASHSNLLDADPPRRQRRHSDGSDNMESSRYRDDDRYRADDRYRTNDRYTRRSPTPERNGLANAAPLISSGYKRLPLKNVSEKPIRTTLIKKKTTDGKISGMRAKGNLFCLWRSEAF